NAYTIDPGTGGTLTMDNGTGAANFTILSGVHLVTAPMTLNSNTNFTTTNAADQLTITSSIGGTGGLTKAGPGTLVLTSNSTYLGTTKLNGGSLIVHTSQGLGDPSAPLSTSPSSSPTNKVTLDLASDTSIAAYNMTEGNAGETVILSDK